MKRLHSSAEQSFFGKFVYRYADKQYQTWLGSQFTHVGIDFSYQKELQDRIFAGIANHFLDYSFSAALKLAKDVDRTNEIPIFERKFDAVEYVFFATGNSFLKARRPELAEDHHYVYHAELFLLRALTSLQAARRLINWGFFSEPLTILRSTLEQLAWAHSVGVAFNQKQLANPQPPKCIGPFRTRFAAAGHLYGALSTFSHMDFQGQKHFVGLSEGRSAVVQQSTEFKFFGLLFLAFVMIAHHYVCRDLQEFYEANYGMNYRLNNCVLPLRYLLLHALKRPELFEDEIAGTLSEAHSMIFSGLKT